jgi:ABC-type enterochelin transport system substrate-binding protein
MQITSEKNNSDTLVLKINNFPEFRKIFDIMTEAKTDSRVYSIDEINNEIFEYIKENTTTEKACILLVSYNKIDKYGNSVKTDYSELGTIDALELIKYNDSKLWVSATCGIIFIKYGQCF